MKRLVGARLGLGALSKCSLTEELAERKVSIVKLPGWPIRRKLAVISRADKRVTRALQQFVDLVPYG